MTSNNIISCTSRISLRPNDFDWSKFLNNSVYPQLFEFARWDWARINKVNLEQSNIAAVVVRMEIDFISPVIWNPIAEVLVDTELDSLNAYSFSIIQTVRSVEGDMKAKARIKLALFDFVSNQIKPVSILESFVIT